MYKLSSAQKRLFILNELENHSTIKYNMPSIHVIDGDLDITRLKETMKKLIMRHSSFRTYFYKIEGEIVQDIIEEELDPDIEFIHADGEKSDYPISKFIEPFDLSKAPLLRTKLIKLSEKKHILFIDMHHLISDGVSMGIFLSEFSQIYNDIELEDIDIEYIDFAEWQNELFESGQIKSAEEYWLEKLSGELPILDLPADYIRPGIQTSDGDKFKSKLDVELTAKLRQICEKYNVTLYMLVLSIYYVLLHKYTGQEDIIVGTPLSGRNHPDIQNVIGMFVNTLALRNYPGGAKVFTDFLSEIKENCLSAFENQDYPFDLLVENVVPYRDISRNPIFDTMFVLQNLEVSEVNLPGLSISSLEHDFNISKFDLTFTCFESDDSIGFEIEYCTKLFKRETIERLSNHFINILSDVVSNPGKKISDINILSDEEKNKILFEFNNTKTIYPKHKTLVELFEEQVEKTPGGIALLFEDKRMTYKELNERSNQLAHTLRESGTGANDIIAIIADRSFEMLISIVAVLKSGGAYLPIDPSHPGDRIKFMVEDCKAKIILVQEHLMDKFGFDAVMINLNSGTSFSGNKSNPGIINKSGDLAYVIYTSGSTGTPKGSLARHYNVYRVVKDTNYIDIYENDSILQLSNYAFDGSIFDIFGALLNGAKLVLVNKDVVQDPSGLSELIQRTRISVFFITTAYFNTLIDINIECFRNIRKVLFGGETVSLKHVKKLFEFTGKNKILHMYGPTESTVYTTCYPVCSIDGDMSTVPIGKPLSNTLVLILDKEDNLCPIGVKGELCISGDGLAKEYLNRESLTKEKFTAHPFIKDKRMYRTGDLAKWLPDGNIEFAGRIDHQVKIRGFRIELGEIENTISKYNGIKDSIVIDRADAAGHKYVCAYFVSQDDVEIGSLRNYLSKSLPDYMIPAYFIPLDKLPLNLNGKVNRQLLPLPGENTDSGVIYAAPRNEIEEKLVEIWKDVLGITKVGINDNFFHLGGHSLKATLLVSKIHKKLLVDLSLKEIFENPTVSNLATHIINSNKVKFLSIAPVEKKDYYPVSSTQKRLYVLSRFEEDLTNYNIPNIFSIDGYVEKNYIEHIFKKLINRHESLRTRFDTVNDEIVQIIEDIDNIDFKIEYSEYTTHDEIENLISSFIKPFDLNQAPLFRVKLLRLSGTRHILFIDMHHLISDGVSMGILFNDLSKFYDGEELEALKLQYKDYSGWQNDLFKSQQMLKQKEYWNTVFEGELPVLDFPTDYGRSDIQNFGGNRVKSELPNDISAGVKEIYKNNNTTLYMFLLGCLNILLHKYCSQEDIIIGSPVAGRRHTDLENIIGMFVNTLALRNYPGGAKVFTDFLYEVKENCLSAFENQDYPFDSLVENVAANRDISRNALFDVMFVLQNIDNEGIKIGDLKISSLEHDFNISKFDLTFTCFESDDSIGFEIEYCTKLFKRETIERLSNHFINILSNVVSNPGKKISDINILSDEEKNKILFEFNDTKTIYPKHKTLVELFEEQVEKTPGGIALLFEDKRMTYKELNERSNQLAHTLRESGTGANDIIAIISDRSFEMLISIIAVLKSGGAYLPIDPSHPGDRIKFMVEDCKAKIILVQEHLMDKFGFDAVMINLNSGTSFSGNKSNPGIINKSGDLAYVIYTSGSTGTPKGSLARHYNVYRVVKDTNYIDIYENDSILQLSNYAFDGSIFDIFGALLNGAKLVLVNKDVVQDPSGLSELIQRTRISVFFITTAYFNTLIDINIECFRNIRKVLFGGETVSLKHVKKLFEFTGKNKILHMYGPTESTVYTTCYPVCSIDGDMSTVPIGKPLSNTRVLILDKADNLCPIGVKGELCISGDGLAKEYLNRESLTKEKFAAHPFIKNKRMYRTGDLAKWLPDGNIEFAGRIDHQVKIRGFRIELGEIENTISKYTGIKDSIVIDRADAAGHKYLCAYIVSGDDVEIGSLRNYLSKSLPDYMIPAYFIPLDKLPLNLNGKVNRQLLPLPGENTDSGVIYAAPRNEIEEKLVEIWKDVLGITKVGINDNFFHLGGDSIKSIRIISKLKREDLFLEMKKLLKNPTISSVSKYVQPMKISQDFVSGDIRLTPVQKWFFELKLKAEDHFNQSMVLHSKSGFDITITKKVLLKIMSHHDILRAVYKKENGRVVQSITGSRGHDLQIEYYDLTKDEAYTDTIHTKNASLQGNINLSGGPLVKLSLYKTIKGDYLTIIIHHLVIDGVSWRILLRDFSDGYRQLINNEELRFQDKTNSYKAWSEKLYEYSAGNELLREKDYWKSIVDSNLGYSKLPTDNKSGLTNTVGILELSLSEEYTEKLLKNVNQAYHTEINDILLATVSLAFNKWIGIDKLLINLEGHGRENIIKNMRINRTVGWFTSMYPVLLRSEKPFNLAHTIKNTKEILRSIPNKGVGYGILKYLTPKEMIKDLNFSSIPEVSFNYLGNFGFSGDNEEDLFSITNDVSPGPDIGSTAGRLSLISISCLVKSNRFELFFDFGSEYEKNNALKLTEIYKTSLEEIIDHCTAMDDQDLVQRDVLFSKEELSIEELDGIVEKNKIEKIYRLTPMQEGMLYYHLSEKDNDPYFRQESIMINDIDYNILEKTINKLVRRHDVFRTIFIYKNQKKMSQVVLKEKIFKLFYEDISTLDQENKEKYVESFKNADEKKGFDLSSDFLIRFSLLKLEESSYLLLFSWHHIVIDGWCRNLLFSELFHIYDALKNSNRIRIAEVHPYSDYIKWLDNQDYVKAKEYWRSRVGDYDNPVFPLNKNNNSSDDYTYNDIKFKLSKEITKSLNDIAKKNHTTLNIVIQSLWGILLQKYNNTNDVLFGSVVSGRSADVDGIEKMLGLFINTIPVRVKTGDEMGFTDLIQELNQYFIDSGEYEYYPLSDIQSLTSSGKDLINHLLVFENLPGDHSGKNSGLTIAGSEASRHKITNYDFNIIVHPTVELTILIDFNEDAFEYSKVESLSKHFINLACDIAANPFKKITQLSILSEDERNILLYDFNNTGINYPVDKTIIELFEDQASLVPGNTALIFNDKRMTYKDLNEKSNQLANKLKSLGINKEEIVGVLVERSFEMIIGVFGILKAGCAYMPIDPEYPEQRINFIMKDSQCSILLTQSHLKDKINLNCHILDLNSNQSFSDDKSNPEILRNTPDKQKCLAYIIYTSGSTGTPKGVMIEHGSVLNILQALYEEYPFQEKDAYLLKTSFTFDVSVSEVFGWFLGKGKLVIPESGVEKDPGRLLKYIDKYNITHINFVPSMFKILLESLTEKLVPIINTLKYIFVAGEAISEDVIKKSRALKIKARLENIYGPTEATIYTTRYSLSNFSEGINVPIGKPMPNIKTYILDTNGNLQPIGVNGELCIGGCGLSRGYLNRLELTGENFISSHHIAGERIYKTGDLARWQEDGNIEFLGRIDHQVKIRGFRIEPGEIENAILKYNGIKETVVGVKEINKNESSLIAFIVANNLEEITVGGLKDFLSRILPNYMIPSYFTFIESIPLTVNGKIDKKILMTMDNLKVSSTKSSLPTTFFEEGLATIWKELLGIDEVGVDDNFFQLGGDSIKTITLVNEINRRFNIDLDIGTITRNPTIRELTSLNLDKIPQLPYISFNMNNKQNKIFCFPPLFAVGTAYFELASRLKDFALYSFNYLEEDDDMINTYIHHIKKIKKNGPYIFLGWSGGGNIALEVAKALEKQSSTVSDIIFIDSFTVMPEFRGEFGFFFDDPQYNSVLSAGDNDLRQKLEYKMKKYWEYVTLLVNEKHKIGKVQANLHNVYDPIYKEKDEALNLWQKYTNSKLYSYEGFGNHAYMLLNYTEEGSRLNNVEENSKIIKKILKDLKH